MFSIHEYLDPFIHSRNGLNFPEVKEKLTKNPGEMSQKWTILKSKIFQKQEQHLKNGPKMDQNMNQKWP